jgi:Family of unknown function (DUF5906)/Domain of unknown function (DUF3854)
MAKVIEMASYRRKRLRHAKANRRELRALCIEDFQKSGIEWEKARELGITVCDADELWTALHPTKSATRPRTCTAEGWLVPYLTPDGKPSGFCRARKLRGQWDDTKAGTERRYSQPANSLPHIYVPWPLIDYELSADDKVMLGGIDTLGVTEGEKKAIKAALCGLCYLSLAGVASAGAKRHRITLTSEFHWFTWAELNAEICFDSDAYTNAQVNDSLYQLLYLMRIELKPKKLQTVRLTSESGGKVAMDGFLAEYDGNKNHDAARKAFNALTREEDHTAEAFAYFNARLAWVIKKTRFFNTADSCYFQAPGQVVNQFVGPKVRASDGKTTVLPIKLWLEERSVEHTQVTDVVYAPGRPERFKLSPADEFITFNKWRPSNFAESTKRAGYEHIKPFLAFVEYLTPYLTPEYRGVLLDACAYPLQHLGAKLDFGIIIVSESQGAGKNFFFNILRDFYGVANWHEIDGASLTSRFNDWAQRQLLIVNEVHVPTYGERVAVMARVQTMITEPYLALDCKFMPHENVLNHLNILMSSNHPDDALRLADNDRRFFVIRAPDTAQMWTKEQFVALAKWLDTAGGREAVYRWLMARDVSKFNPHMNAPRTDARLAMIRGGLGILEDIVETLHENPKLILPTGKHQPLLYEPAHIIEMVADYAAKHKLELRGLNKSRLAAAMSKHDFEKRVVNWARSGKHSGSVTCYALENADKWAKRPDREWLAYMKKQHEKGAISTHIDSSAATPYRLKK